MNILLVFLVVTVCCAQVAELVDNIDCYTGTYGLGYRGNLDTASTGPNTGSCIHWITYYKTYYYDRNPTKFSGNKCRGTPGWKPWCYTSKGGTWGYCDVARCTVKPTTERPAPQPIDDSRKCPTGTVRGFFKTCPGGAVCDQECKNGGTCHYEHMPTDPNTCNCGEFTRFYGADCNEAYFTVEGKPCRHECTLFSDTVGYTCQLKGQYIHRENCYPYREVADASIAAGTFSAGFKECFDAIKKCKKNKKCEQSVAIGDGACAANKEVH